MRVRLADAASIPSLPIGGARTRNRPETLLVEARGMTKRQLVLFLGFALLVFAGAALLGLAVNGGV